ncbi:hypothetical protein F2Q68_00020086 [Brassica cretica]|uniref:Uncharacterized protein n=1 Tax=Brassica cretica TaxID=69181 RepID=A0A8S9G248_BRACR|nr:hypothetical protein F2Q68_00020086 [Brassica cretica]
MAISLSDPDPTENADAAQLDAAKRICLKVKALVTNTNLNQKVKDGFCDVYVITSNFISQGRIQCVWFLMCMGSSSDLCFRKCRLQGDFEFLVNRFIDPELKDWRVEHLFCLWNVQILFMVRCK